MNSRIVLLAGASIVVLAAAIAGGYYLGRPEAPKTAQTVSAPVTAPAPATAPEPASAVEPAPSTSASPPIAMTTPKPAQRRRYADYSERESEFAPPPPPPPAPREDWHDRPDPFGGRFSTFPMHHAGSGTAESPLTWSAQTEFASGREADLRISILVPEPVAGDRGEFWRQWGGRDRDNLMPDVTRGTPVVVTGSVSVVVAVDPDMLDLEAPALMIVEGDMGRLVYRSHDVAPARGEAWDSRGARWIFAPDESFYRALRNGAGVSVEVHSRISNRDIRIPFATDDFPPSARDFERGLYARLGAVSGQWNEARDGRAPPPPPPPPSEPVAHPAPVIVPPPPAAPAPGTPPAAQPATPSPQQADGGHPGAHRPGVTPPGAVAPPATPPPTRVAQAPAAPVGAPPSTRSTAPPANAPMVGPPPARTMPAPAAAPPAAPPAKVAQLPPRPATLPVAVPKPATSAAIAAYHPPEDTCGAEPPLPAASPDAYAAYTRPQLMAARPAFMKGQSWISCRTSWIGLYTASVDTLGKAVAPAQPPVAALSANGGAPVVAAYEAALQQNSAAQAQWQAQMRAFQAAFTAPPRGPIQPVPLDNGKPRTVQP